MGHDIYSRNKAGEEIGYLRFSMSDYNAHVVYGVLDAMDCNGGVSGIGACKSLTVGEMEMAIERFEVVTENNKETIKNEPHLAKVTKRIQTFLQDALKTAKKEGFVDIIFS